MKLITCGLCGRPFYDKEKACPYCGHAFDSLPPFEMGNNEQDLMNEVPTIEKETDSTTFSQTSDSNAASNLRAETMAAITSVSVLVESETTESLLDPNQIETTYPPRKRRVWFWIVITLFFITTAAACYYCLQFRH
jgi:uncharacterized Zn finger protein (UPF0148 family)